MPTANKDLGNFVKQGEVERNMQVGTLHHPFRMLQTGRHNTSLGLCPAKLLIMWDIKADHSGAPDSKKFWLTVEQAVFTKVLRFRP